MLYFVQGEDGVDGDTGEPGLPGDAVSYYYEVVTYRWENLREGGVTNLPTNSGII